MSSHDLLQEGVTDAESTCVVVLAEDYTDGALAAAQFVHCLYAMRKSHLDMVTGTYPLLMFKDLE